MHIRQARVTTLRTCAHTGPQICTTLAATLCRRHRCRNPCALEVPLGMELKVDVFLLVFCHPSQVRIFKDEYIEILRHRTPPLHTLSVIGLRRCDFMHPWGGGTFRHKFPSVTPTVSVSLPLNEEKILGASSLQIR